MLCKFAAVLMTTGEPSFDNTEIAFRSRSHDDLRKAELLFRTFNFPWLVKNGPGMAAKAVDFGFKGLIKSTIFSHFCGGETIAECKPTIARLWKHKVGTILDYSVEGEEQETVFEATCNEIIRTIREAAGSEAIPFSVFKTTGIARFALLEKVQQGAVLTPAEQAEWEKVRERFIRVCQAAHDQHVRLFVDAEETWIQERKR